MVKNNGIRCDVKDCVFRDETGSCEFDGTVIGPNGRCIRYRRAADQKPPVPGRPKRRLAARARGRTITYRLEMVSCGKCERCKEKPSHGPYWYAYWKENGRTRSQYLGKGKVVRFDRDDDET